MKHIKLFEQFINEAADFKLRWLNDEPELAEILKKDISKLWKKHKLDDEKHNRPKDSKWGPSKWGASYTFRKGHSKKYYRDTTELQWSRAEGFSRPAEDDEKGGHEHIMKFVKDVMEVLSKNGYKSKRLPTGGPDRYDHLVIWHNKDVEKTGPGFSSIDEGLVTEGIENDEGVAFSKKGIKTNSPNWYLKRFASESVAKKYKTNLEKMMKAMDKENIKVGRFLQGSKLYDDVTVMSGKDFKKKYPGMAEQISSMSQYSGGNSYRQNPWNVIWDYFQNNKELHKYW